MRLILWLLMCSMLVHVPPALAKNMCLLLQGVNVYKCQISPIGAWYSNFLYSYCLSVTWTTENGVSPFIFVSFCFMYFGALLLGVYIFRMTSSWGADHFIIRKCPLLSIVTVLVRKSAFFDINTATPVYHTCLQGVSFSIFDWDVWTIYEYF